MTDDELLAHLPEISAVASQVEDRLRSWVGTARQRRISWARIGAALGMTRQSAWELYARDVFDEIAASAADPMELSDDDALSMAVSEVKAVRSRRRAG